MNILVMLLRQQRNYRRTGHGGTWHLLLSALILAVVLMATTSCESRMKTKYGLGFDGERQKRAVPILGSQAHTSGDWGLSWNYKHPLGFKGRSWKRIEIDNGQISSETDSYESGIPFTSSAGGKGYETLQIKYSYTSPSNSAWSAVHFFKDGESVLSLSEAEALLAKWGINRLEVPQ